MSRYSHPVVKHATLAFCYGGSPATVAHAVSTPQQKFTRKNAEKLKQAIETKARTAWIKPC